MILEVLTIEKSSRYRYNRNMNKIEHAFETNQSALQALIAFRRAALAISKQETELIKQHQLTLTQFGVLEVLHYKGNLRIQDLIDRLLTTSGNMTVVIRNMIRDGYIYRLPDERDKRACLISLTDFGRQTIEAILPAHYDNVGEIFSVLTAEEQEQLTSLLKQFKKK